MLYTGDFHLQKLSDGGLRVVVMGALTELGTAVDAVVAIDLSALSMEQLQQAYSLVSPQVQRLEGFGSAVLAELHSRGGAQLPTGDGGSRSLAGWAAEASGDSPSAAGRRLRTATALEQGLPAVARAVLDGEVGFKAWARAGREATWLLRHHDHISPDGP